MVLKQVLRDIQKEWTWAIFYIIVATMTAMAILYLSVSFSSVRKQYSSIRSYIDKEVVMFQFMPTQMEPASSNRQISNSPDVISYLQHNLSADGNAGSYVFIGNDGFVDAKYGSILILFGQYGNLAGLRVIHGLFYPRVTQRGCWKEFYDCRSENRCHRYSRVRF